MSGDYKSREDGRVTKMLLHLELRNPTGRRRMNRLTYLYKIAEGLVPAISAEEFLHIHVYMYLRVVVLVSSI